jgi:hypothetical protein
MRQSGWLCIIWRIEFPAFASGSVSKLHHGRLLILAEGRGSWLAYDLVRSTSKTG